MEDWFDEIDKEQEEFDKGFARFIPDRESLDQMANLFPNDLYFGFFCKVLYPMAFAGLHMRIRQILEVNSPYVKSIVEKTNVKDYSTFKAFSFLKKFWKSDAVLVHTKQEAFIQLRKSVETNDEYLFKIILDGLDSDERNVILSLSKYLDHIISLYLLDKVIKDRNYEPRFVQLLCKETGDNLPAEQTDESKEDYHRRLNAITLFCHFQDYKYLNDCERNHFESVFGSTESQYGYVLERCFADILTTIKGYVKGTEFEQEVNSIIPNEATLNEACEAVIEFFKQFKIINKTVTTSDGQQRMNNQTVIPSKPSTFTIEDTHPNIFGSGDEDRKYIRGLKTEYKDPLWIENFINWLAQSKQIANDTETKLLLSTRLLGRDMTGGNLFEENGEPRKIEWLGKVNNLFYMVKTMFNNNNKVTPTQLFFSCKNDTKGLLAGKNHSQCSKDAEKEFKDMIDEK